MSDQSLESLYTAKNPVYFERSRPELLPFVPASARKILDVGCGAGGFAAEFKTLLQAEVWGVELNQEASAIARGRLDQVFHAPFGPELGLPHNYFDCIFFNDVLEHMLEPVAALRLALTLLSETGVVVASIPNIGRFPEVWKLVVRGEWDYKDQGILDKTHLGFYTRKSIAKLFEKSGYEVEKIQGINDFFQIEPDDKELWWKYRFLSWLPIRSVREMRHLQYAVVARRRR